MPYLFELYRSDSQDVVQYDVSPTIDDIYTNNCLVSNSDIIDVDDVRAELEAGIEGYTPLDTDDDDFYIVATKID